MDMQNNPGMANGQKRGSRPDICTIQVKEPKDASDGQRAYYRKVVEAKNYFMHRPFAAPGQLAPVVLGMYGDMAVLVAAHEVEQAGIDVMALFNNALNGKTPKAKTETEGKTEGKGKAEGKGKTEGKTEAKPKAKGKKAKEAAEKGK